jgi:phospho-N-acetylmuramoyl-pentapeptide-transferase
MTLSPAWVTLNTPTACPISYPFIGAGLGLFWVLLFMPAFIRLLKQRQYGQYIREDGPQSHLSKTGTPTGGGVLIVLATVLSVATPFAFHPDSFLQPGVADMLAVLLVILVLAGMGFCDDWLKINKQKNKGLSGWSKLAIQSITGLALGMWLFTQHGVQTTTLPGGLVLDLGWGYPLFAAFALVGGSNAVNLTDGLDGLAAGTGIISLLGLVAMFLLMPATPVWLLMLAVGFMGALIGFLWFNRHPARIFMGDTGSLALGGGLAAMALSVGQEWLLLLLGSVFILETLSVMLQVGSFKLTGKRVFKMAPLHHHFELCGWHETQVVWAFCGFQLLTSLIAIALFVPR